MDKPSILTIKFANDEAREHFASWLCGSGEQAYWDWMEYRETEEDTPEITALSFDYFAEGQKEFVSDGVIGTTCGRKDQQ